MQGYSYTYGGATINDLASIQTGEYIAVQSVGGFTAPSLRHSQSSIAGDHGITDHLSYVGSRIISLEGVIHADTEAALLVLEDAFLRAWIIPDIPTPTNRGYDTLTFSKTGETSKYVNAKIHALPRIERALHSRCTKNFFVQFRCEDPRIYSTTQKTEQLVKSVLTSGFPAPMPRMFGGTATAYEETIINNGNWSAPISYVIGNTGFGTVLNPRLTNSDLNTYQEFTTTMAEGDTITVDTLAGTAVDQDGVNILNLETAGSEWLYISPDTSGDTFKLTADDGEPVVDITWNDTWISAPR